jgi:hypothetical protein
MFQFEKLLVYQKALDYADEVYGERLDSMRTTVKQLSQLLNLRVVNCSGQLFYTVDYFSSTLTLLILPSNSKGLRSA